MAEINLSDIKQIKVVDSELAANELLKEGWVLLGVATGSYRQEYETTPCFKYSLGSYESPSIE